jgi:hypothetical protein
MGLGIVPTNRVVVNLVNLDRTIATNWNERPLISTGNSFGAGQDAERRPGCSASGPTSSVDGAVAGQMRARASVQAPGTQ